MFIATALLHDGQQLLILGLSLANLDRLVDGQPMDISRATHGTAIPANLRICIFAGDTEETMRDQMADLIGPTTVVDQKKPS